MALAHIMGVVSRGDVIRHNASYFTLYMGKFCGPCENSRIGRASFTKGSSVSYPPSIEKELNRPLQLYIHTENELSWTMSDFSRRLRYVAYFDCFMTHMK